MAIGRVGDGASARIGGDPLVDDESGEGIGGSGGDDESLAAEGDAVDVIGIDDDGVLAGLEGELGGPV